MKPSYPPCAAFRSPAILISEQRLLPRELAEWLAGPADQRPLLVDVREEWEFEIGHLAGSICLPLAELATQAPRLPSGQAIVLICHHGVRSLMAARLLAHQGFSHIYDLKGGIDLWSAEIDPAIRRY